MREEMTLYPSSSSGTSMPTALAAVTITIATFSQVGLAAARMAWSIRTLFIHAPNRKAQPQPPTGSVAEADDVIIPMSIEMPRLAAVGWSVFGHTLLLHLQAHTPTQTAQIGVIVVK